MRIESSRFARSLRGRRTMVTGRTVVALNASAGRVRKLPRRTACARCAVCAVRVLVERTRGTWGRRGVVLVRTYPARRAAHAVRYASAFRSIIDRARVAKNRRRGLLRAPVTSGAVSHEDRARFLDKLGGVRSAFCTVRSCWTSDTASNLGARVVLPFLALRLALVGGISPVRQRIFSCRAVLGGLHFFFVAVGASFANRRRHACGRAVVALFARAVAVGLACGSSGHGGGCGRWAVRRRKTRRSRGR